MALQSDPSITSCLVTEVSEVSSDSSESSPVSSDNESSSTSSDIEDISEDSEQQPGVSLLSKLKPPPASEFGRKRKVKTNPPPTGKRRSKGSSAYQLKKIQAHTRVKEFPKEPFKVNYNKKLFCMACREELCLKLSSIRSHILSCKHKQGTRDKRSKRARYSQGTEEA